METRLACTPNALSRWVPLILVWFFFALAASGVIDRAGEQYTQSGFKRALTTFAIARTLNGLISVAQETELAVQPGGLGVTLAPGQILDPVNDLIERFSWVMLAATTSLGLQSVILEMARWPLFTVALGLVCLAWTALWWRKRAHPDQLLNHVFTRAMVVFMLLRLAIPVAATASEWTYQAFLSPRYEQSLAVLSETSQQVETLNSDTPETSAGSLPDKARLWLNNARNTLDLPQHLKKLGDTASQASESAINLIVVFLIQTALLPLLILWILWRGTLSLLFRRKQ